MKNNATDLYTLDEAVAHFECSLYDLKVYTDRLTHVNYWMDDRTGEIVRALI